MTTTRSSRLCVVASLVMFSVGSLAATRQAHADPVIPPGKLIKIPSGVLKTPPSPGKIVKIPDGIVKPLPPLPGPVIPGPLPKPDRPHRPGRGGGHWGGGMAVGVVSGMALGAMAAQARPVAVAEECWLEERRVRDAYGNRYIKEVRVCDE